MSRTLLILYRSRAVVEPYSATLHLRPPSQQLLRYQAQYRQPQQGRLNLNRRTVKISVPFLPTWRTSAIASLETLQLLSALSTQGLSLLLPVDCLARRTHPLASRTSSPLHLRYNNQLL